MNLTPECERVQETLANGRADQPHHYHRSYAALISHLKEMMSICGQTSLYRVLLTQMMTTC